MQDWLASRAEVSPDKIAIIEHISTTHKNEISYKNLSRRVDEMCQKMMLVGIEPGQHVAMLMMNSIPGIVPFFAAMRLGLVFVPLNTRLTIDEIDFQLKQSDVDWLLLYGMTDMLAGLRDKGHNIANFKQKIKQKKFTVSAQPVNLEKPFLIVHTSGTSGKPKGAPRKSVV